MLVQKAVAVAFAALIATALLSGFASVSDELIATSIILLYSCAASLWSSPLVSLKGKANKIITALHVLSTWGFPVMVIYGSLNLKLPFIPEDYAVVIFAMLFYNNLATLCSQPLGFTWNNYLGDVLTGLHTIIVVVNAGMIWALLYESSLRNDLWKQGYGWLLVFVINNDVLSCRFEDVLKHLIVI